MVFVHLMYVVSLYSVLAELLYILKILLHCPAITGMIIGVIIRYTSKPSQNTATAYLVNSTYTAGNPPPSIFVHLPNSPARQRVNSKLQCKGQDDNHTVQPVGNSWGREGVVSSCYCSKWLNMVKTLHTVNRLLFASILVLSHLKGWSSCELVFHTHNTYKIW